MVSIFHSVIGSSSKGLSLIRVTYGKNNDRQGCSNSSPRQEDIFLLTKFVDQAAKMLTTQWPRGGPTSTYKEKIMQKDSSNNFSSCYALPCSYLLIENNENCIG